MPVRCGATTKDGKRIGYCRWGSSGKLYYYELGDKASKERAYEKAARQGRAVQANRG